MCAKFIVRLLQFGICFVKYICVTHIIPRTSWPVSESYEPDLFPFCAIRNVYNTPVRRILVASHLCPSRGQACGMDGDGHPPNQRLAASLARPPASSAMWQIFGHHHTTQLPDRWLTGSLLSNTSSLLLKTNIDSNQDEHEALSSPSPQAQTGLRLLDSQKSGV